uniref:Uncharacterized protein n=1 Tax=Streptomyces avermitilis TaxID=33903 RepID=A0A499VAF6_STRAX|nr:hypothetical protein SAVMC3_19870 [Streptomyces avermitilis]
MPLRQFGGGDEGRVADFLGVGAQRGLHQPDEEVVELLLDQPRVRVRVVVADRARLGEQRGETPSSSWVRRAAAAKGASPG